MADDSIIVYFTGIAGSGKSTLVWAMAEWMDTNNISVSIINLDPGVKDLIYGEAEIDIRDYITLEDIMAEYNLGPNGAQIAAADLIALYSNLIKENVDRLKTSYVLVDTPGQIELFAFRTSSRNLVRTLGEGHSAMVFVVDPFLCTTPKDFVSQIFLASTVQLRFTLPIINVLSKVDLLANRDVERIITWSEDYNVLYEALIEYEASMEQQLSVEVFRALDALGVYRRLLPVSALDMIGLDAIYTHMQSIFYGGEDITG